ncbi:MAG: TSUP family transporter [Oscillospiraceae bacterium]
MKIIDIIAIIISAIISSMGLGGGGVLILYLTLFKGTEQLLAQGINLLFFIPCAITSLIIYTKRKLINYKFIFPIVIGGFFGIFFGKFVLGFLPTKLLNVLFSLFLIIVGIMTVFSKKETSDK